MTNLSHSPSTPAEARRTQMIILASLPLGVTLFAAVGLWVTRGGTASDPGPLVAIWTIGLVSALVAASIAWQRMVRPHLPASRPRGQPVTMDEIGRFQTGLIICMALVEGIAMFGGVILILSGVSTPAVVGVALAWGALVVLWPRREWYGLP